MMIRLATWLCLSVLTFGLAACSTGQSGGSLFKPVASSNKIITSMGQGLLGPKAAQLDSSTLQQALTAEYQALEYRPIGEKTTWRAANNMAQGTVTPGQPYQVGSQNCRQYQHDFVINGIPANERGSACRNDDGSWSPLT